MVYKLSKRKVDAIWGGNMKTRLINEVGHIYGPWKVTELLAQRYIANGTARFKVVCRHCGYTKVYIGNNLRFDHFAHHCDRCKRT